MCSYLERLKQTLRIENFDKISKPITKTINNKFNEISKLRNNNFKNCIKEIENSSFTLGQLAYIQSNIYIKTRSYYTNINETNLIKKLQNILYFFTFIYFYIYFYFYFIFIFIFIFLLYVFFRNVIKTK